ncbi:MAG: uroporphyrinogen decarboxylase [Armatimonadota bacterium]|nr:uroporphyrinogen decarboxylase [Armatimonadota bacterium]MDR7402395.1 uroporphyrinogen decarboxylase [Armatimonadota bacterium]MDR7404081.1 uroporphyrinogen decarboxylase [Armatimonadota bacterium]MDR7437584.1 uroporphyrinogen decarboxylase [Armatimonadota bacterium]MDR7472178.1 uroporphyrinogen decarboxylase [Armatimonadota bacterium]
MTDRFLRACRREPTDCTPVWFMRQAGRSQPEYRALRRRLSLEEIFRRPDLVAEVTVRPVEQLGVDAAIVFADIILPLRSLGVAVDVCEGRGPVVAAPVRTASAVEALRPWAPDPETSGVLEGLRLASRACPVPVIGFAGGPFTLACYLVDGGPSRDFPETRRLLHRDPALWQALMARLTDATIAYLRAQVAAGAHAVQVFDSWAGCLSPHDYARAVAPFMGRIFDALRAAGVPSIHFGTGTAGLLEAMAACGGDVIGVDWRVRLADAWARIGPRAIQGNLDPAAAVDDPAAMERAARAVLDDAAGRPGHIFNLGHGVLPQTPPEHLRRLAEFVHEQTASAEVRA